MRFDLVDLQLFIAVADDAQHHPRRGARPSRAGLGQRADQGAGGGARRRAAQARPPRRRVDRGRRKPARSCPDRHAQCRCDARRSRRFASGVQGERAFARQYIGPVGASAEGAGRLPCASIPHITIDVEERESTDIAAAIGRRRRSRICRRARAARPRSSGYRSARTA